MAVTPDDIRKLEEAMQFFGIEGITVDGDAGELLAKIAPFLDKFSPGLAGNGGAFSVDDLLDSATRDDRIADIADRVQGIANSPQLGLVREIFSAQPNYQNIEKHLTDIGIPGAQGLVPQLKNILENGTTPHDLLYGGPSNSFGFAVLPMIKNLDSFKQLQERLGDNAINNIEEALSMIDDVDTWFEVIEELKPDIPTDPAELAELIETLKGQQDLAAAAAEVAKAERLQDVESYLLGVDAADGIWGREEQLALIEAIKGMQESDFGSAWEGPKDGIFTQEFADFVLSDQNQFRPEQKDFIRQLIAIQRDGVDLVNEDDKPINSAAVKGSITAIEEMLRVLTPYVQEQLDAEKAKAEALIRSIESGAASETEIKHATAALKSANAVLESGTASPAEIEAAQQQKAEAMEYLNRSGLGDTIGDFIDGFLLLDQYDWGSKMVEAGKSWSVDMIRGRLASYNDLPELNPDNFGDGRLDIHEQTALQGVLFLMADRLGVPGGDHWKYTPELGEAIIAKLPSLPLAQKEELIALVPAIGLPANYEDMSPEEKNAALNAEITKGVGFFVDQLNIAHRAGVLVPHRLYLAEEVEIPKVTKEIFTEFVKGNIDPLNPHYHEDAATPIERNMLNLLVSEFTEGFDLADMMGEDFDSLEVEALGTDAEAIAARFEELYRADVDLEEMGKMLETLPFGTDTRREMFRDLLKKLEDEEKEGATIAVLATMFGEGVAAINATPEAGSGYLHRWDRPIVSDPRLSDFSINGGTVDAEAIRALHTAENNNFHADTIYQPTYFKDDAGDIYVAAVDVQSRIFQIEKLDLEGWRQTLAENAKRPGESDYDHTYRVDQALRNVSGYELIFQNMFEDGQATLGGSIMNFPSASFEASIPSYADLDARVDGIIAEREAAQMSETVKAATPGNSSVIEEFGEAVSPVGDIKAPDSLDQFDRNSVDREIYASADASELSHDGLGGPAMHSGQSGR